MSYSVDYVSGKKIDAGASAVIYGLNPIPGQLDRTIAALAESGPVFTYKYDENVVTDGDPQTLVNLIEEIRSDVQEKTDGVNPERIRMAGASLGAFIAYNIQKELDLQMAGLYSSAGVNFARNLMRNPIFWQVRKAFKQNSYGIKELDAAWKDIDIYPDKPGMVPFVCAISRLDPVVPYPFAARNLNSWRDAGAPIKVLPNWVVRHEGRLLHTAAIGYFDSSIREIIEISENK